MVLYWSSWFLEEPLTSIELFPWHKRDFIVGKGYFYMFKIFFTPRKTNGGIKSCSMGT